MTQDGTDCIGAGSYYLLDQPTPSSIISPAALAATTAGQHLEEADLREIRIHPETGEPYCLNAMISDLHDPDWYIRIRAAWAIGSTGDIEGMVPLLEALNDGYKEVRDRAQDALHAMEAVREPLHVRVLLCETVDDAQRTDMLLALMGTHAARGLSFGYGSARAYCEHWLEETSAGMSEDEQSVLGAIKRAAEAVLTELSRRSESHVLLRPSDANNAAHQHQLLRSSEPGNRPGEVENLLLPSGEGTGGNGGNRGN